MSKPTKNQKYVNNSRTQVVCRKCGLPFFQLLKIEKPDGTVEYEHANPKVMCIMARAKLMTIEKAQVRHQAAKAREHKKRLEGTDGQGGQGEGGNTKDTVSEPGARNA